MLVHSSSEPWVAKARLLFNTIQYVVDRHGCVGNVVFSTAGGILLRFRVSSRIDVIIISNHCEVPDPAKKSPCLDAG